MLVVTGGDGYIGRELCKALCQENVVCVGRPEKSDLIRNFNFYATESHCSDVFQHMDVKTIIHLANIAHNKYTNERDVYEVNCLGTINLAKQAARNGVKRFIYISSIYLCNLSSEELDLLAKEDVQLHSKALAEKELMQLSESTEMDIVIIRSALVYGGDSPGNMGVMSKVIRKFGFLPFASLKQVKPYVDIRNLVDLIIHCISFNSTISTFLVAMDDRSYNLSEIIRVISKPSEKRLFFFLSPIFC